MLKKKKTTASGKLVLVKSVRRTRSHRMKFCVQRGLGALPSTSKQRAKSQRDFAGCYAPRWHRLRCLQSGTEQLNRSHYIFDSFGSGNQHCPRT